MPRFENLSRHKAAPTKNQAGDRCRTSAPSRMNSARTDGMVVSEFEARTYRRVAGRLLPLLFAGYVVAYLNLSLIHI